MTIDRKTFKERLRQLMALDQNAFDIYTDLAALTEDQELRKSFLGVADDEKRHTALDKELIALLGG
jgi:rubrerythrin